MSNLLGTCALGEAVRGRGQPQIRSRKLGIGRTASDSPQTAGRSPLHKHRHDDVHVGLGAYRPEHPWA